MKTRAKRSSGRLTGRLVIFVWAALLLGAVGVKAAPVKTVVQDTLYRADGNAAQGDITICWPGFSTSAGEAVAAGQMTVKTDANGGISIPLIPNTGSSPSGSYYRVVIKLDDGTTSEEMWVVPAVATTTVAAIRAKVVPQAVAVQFASQDSVDTALAQVVHLAGTETIQGAKTFVPSPQVPVPSVAGGAANKGYVDQAIAGLATVASTGNYNDLTNKPAGASLASPGAIGSITPGPVNATVYTVNGAPLASANLSDGTLLARTSTTINGFPISSNVTLSASNLTMGALPNGTTATTQAVNDNSSKLATTQYVAASLAAPGSIGATTPGPVNATAITASGNLAAGTTCPAGMTSGAVCAANILAAATPFIDVRTYRADPTCTTDSTAALLNAAAASCAVPGVASPKVVPILVSPGCYLTSLDLTQQSCVPLFLGQDENATTFQYNGTGNVDANGNDTFVVKTTPYATFGGFKGISIYGNNPTTGALAKHLVWVTGAPDNTFNMDHVHFSQSLSHAFYLHYDVYSSNASTTASSTTVAVPSVATSRLKAGLSVYLLGAGVAGANLHTTVSTVDTVNNLITVAAAPSTTLTGNAVISANYQTGLTNLHMDHVRWDGVGGAPIYLDGSSYDESRPVTITNFTVSVDPPSGLVGSWLTANGLNTAPNWGDAVVVTNNGIGLAIEMSGGRVELDTPQVVIGNLDNAALLRSTNESNGGPALFVYGVTGFSSSLDEPMVSSSNGKTELWNFNTSFAANGLYKNVATQAIAGAKYDPKTMAHIGYNGQQGGLLTFNGGQKFGVANAPETSSSVATFYANDVIMHPSSESAAGTKGAMRYVTATGVNSSGTPISTGSCQAYAATVTSTATVTSGNNVIALAAQPGFTQIGENVTLVGAGAGGADLNTQITAISYTAPYSVTTVDTPSTSVTPATVNWQKCTFHELPGAATASSAPSSGTYFAGEKVWNTNTASGQPIYWVCTTGGSPCGAWTNGPVYGTSAAPFITSLTTTGTSGAATVTSGVLNVPIYTSGGLTGACDTMQGCIEQFMIGSSNGWTAHGGYITNTTGSTVAQVSPTATQPLIQMSTSGSSAGNAAGWYAHAETYLAWQPLLTFDVLYNASADYTTTGSRIWLGYFGNTGCGSTSTPIGSDTPACGMAAIRFSQVAGDTYYQLVTSGSGSAWTVTSIGVAPTTAWTKMSINIGASSVTACVGATCVTNTTNLPGQSALYYPALLNSISGGGTTHLGSSNIKAMAQNRSW